MSYVGLQTLSTFFFSGYIKNHMGVFKDCGCGCGGAKAQQKFLISVMSALVFFVISNPKTYRLTRGIFGNWVSGPTGCPTIRGLVLHAVVFVVVTWAMMNIKKEGYAVEENIMDIGPAPEMEEKKEGRVFLNPPPAMVDSPEPLPGFTEPQLNMFDSGAEYASLDVAGGEADKPAAVSCSCADGSSVSISR
mgnify:FL=1